MQAKHQTFSVVNHIMVTVQRIQLYRVIVTCRLFVASISSNIALCTNLSSSVEIVAAKFRTRIKTRTRVFCDSESQVL